MCRRIVFAFLVLVFCSASALAAQIGGGSSGGLGFTCDPMKSYCQCDGSYIDCKDMKDMVCKGGNMTCGWFGDKPFCQCTKKTALTIPTKPSKPAGTRLNKK